MVVFHRSQRLPKPGSRRPPTHFPAPKMAPDAAGGEHVNLVADPVSGRE